MLRPTPPQSTAPLSPKSPLSLGRREAHTSNTTLAEQEVHSVESNRAFNQVRAAVNRVTDLLVIRSGPILGRPPHSGPPSVALRPLLKPHPLKRRIHPTSHTLRAPPHSLHSTDMAREGKERTALSFVQAMRP
jgi:hypothetical protein